MQPIEQIRVYKLDLVSNIVQYSTHVEKFKYTRKAKIKTNHRGTYFVCIFGIHKEVKCQRMVYTSTIVPYNVTHGVWVWYK